MGPACLSAGAACFPYPLPSLAHALSAGGGLPLHDPLHPEVRTLRERLEEEQMALAARERDKTALEGRIARLTHCILHGSAAATQVGGGMGEGRGHCILWHGSHGACSGLESSGKKKGRLFLYLLPYGNYCASAPPARPIRLQMERRLRAPAAEQAAAAALSATLAREATSRSGLTAQAPLGDVATTVAAVRGAGALFPGQDLEKASSSR
jgi:hypothetical protein